MADKHLDHLAAVPLFRGCGKKDLQRVARLTDEVEVEAGRELIQEGKRGTEAFVVVEGTAIVTRGGTQVATLGAGEPFGEMALLDQSPRNATVTAKTPMTLLVIGQREFGGLLDEVPTLARRVMATLAARLREKDEQLYG